METSSDLRLCRSQIVAGIFSVMFLLWSEIPVTLLWAHVISGQSHGDDDEFQDWRECGLPSRSLSSNSIDRSVLKLCEITWKGWRDKNMNRLSKRARAKEKGGFDIFGIWVGYRHLRREEYCRERNGVGAKSNGGQCRQFINLRFIKWPWCWFNLHHLPQRQIRMRNKMDSWIFKPCEIRFLHWHSNLVKLHHHMHFFNFL